MQTGCIHALLVEFWIWINTKKCFLFEVTNLTVNLVGFKLDYQERIIKKKCTINELNTMNFHDSISNLYKIFLFCLEHSAWLVSDGFQDLFGTKVSWLLSISPELWVLPSPGTTWYHWCHNVSYTCRTVSTCTTVSTATTPWWWWWPQLPRWLEFWSSGYITMAGKLEDISPWQVN